MHNRWSEAGAARALERWGKPWGEAVALRCYSSRLIGADPALVLHGGGNTSCKDRATDVLGESREALFVKGSGWDLADLEPPGLPAVDLSFLRRMRALEVLSDEDMVNAQRTHLFDASAPNPSVETLLHAFLPHTFVDHSHANAIVALTNTVHGQAIVREALGADVAIVPYVMAGFQLARLAADVHDAHPGCIGLVLMNHGLFTFGDTAEQSYSRHIEVVQRAEDFLNGVAGPPVDVPIDVDSAKRRALRLLPMLRGSLSRHRQPGAQRWILDYRGAQHVLGHVNRPDIHGLALSGPLTPDHVIRTKRLPLFLDLDPAADDAAWQAQITAKMDAFRDAVDREFEDCAAAAGGVDAYTRLDNTPRVVIVPGVGLFGVGASPKAARIAADIAEHTLHTKVVSSALGVWRGLDRHQLFEMEYWSLEQAKLGRGRAPALARRVAMITGGAGAIGVGVARVLRESGAVVALLDCDAAALERAVDALEGPAEDLLCCIADVTDPVSIRQAFDAVLLRWGGVDLVVVNAGIADQGNLGQMPHERWQRVVDVNLGGAWNTLDEAARRLISQDTGGGVVVVSTKNVAAPGKGFAAYSASKAGAHQLARVAALELAESGIRVNLVAPDAVFSEGDVPSGLWQSVGPDRAASRGMTLAELPEFYRQRNLLKRTVTGADVGRAVVFFASEQTPTTGAVLPVDGGLPAAFPR
jgi:rhamnulose-1-phosphate aldolase/alcohol dehydrogenase